ncbi:hypothetical protein F5878DRAFT_668620 [Lentinula raphanica]|uniref:T6SS Phospholipase effector Tle1-like catalytic domain-containing protein n=1 Tax=Lentinula raphanica TaxID=153919 RepID=A0AA38PMY5_9AGAR|nr:hypothetical protein F5878DRAFT_668620 [Lentinula raphanica]
MLDKVGLLPMSGFQQIRSAYELFIRTDETGWQLSQGFKKTFCRPVTIDFVGVWESMDSVGLLPKRLSTPISNITVRTFRHTLSLDERRTKFRIRHREFGPPLYSENPLDISNSTTTDAREVWFAVIHLHVGGGSVKDNIGHSLGRISLRWMIRECLKANMRIVFRPQRLKEVGLEPSTLYPVVTSRPQPLSGEDRVIESMILKDNPNRCFRAFGVCKTSPNQERGLASDSISSRHLTEEEEELADALSYMYGQFKVCHLAHDNKEPNATASIVFQVCGIVFQTLAEL